MAPALPEPAAAKRPLSYGLCGLDVRNLNKELRALPLLKPGGNCFGQKTRISVLAFQRYRGLAADGVVGRQTRRMLQKTKRFRIKKTSADGRGRQLPKKYYLVDLNKQLLFVVNNRRIRFAAPISSGKPGYATPTGVYRVYRKEEMSWSNPYSVWMPWSVYFNGGIAMHQSTSVPNYPASHGCVRLHRPVAKKIYKQARLGQAVAVF
jgi:hypothetical protein